MPSMLPVGEPPSFIVRKSVTICKTSMMARGIHRKPMMIAAPKRGTPRTASKAPVVHFNILEVEIENTSEIVIFSLNYNTSTREGETGGQVQCPKLFIFENEIE